jgi:predicted Zn-dependent peptidase
MHRLSLVLKPLFVIAVAGLIVALAFRAWSSLSDENAARRSAAAASAFRIPVFYETLPNGLRVVVSEDHSAPVVLVEVMYKIGFRLEPKGRTGFAHLFEHMMFQGSAGVGKFEHVQIVNANGGVVNGSTRFDYTNYFQVMPSNALELALWLEADRMRSLEVTPENLKNQQNVVSEEVRVNVLNQPYGAFEWLSLPQRANTNWYNAHNFYGDLTDLEAATIDDVRAFFDTYYAPNNAVLVVTGDATPAEVMELARKYFGDLPSRQLPPEPDVSEPAQAAEKTFTEEDKLARTPAVAIGYHLPPRLSRDFYALSLLDPLLVGDESARWFQKLVKETQMATALIGGFNLLGNNFDMKGPMLYTVRVDYKPDRTARDVMTAMDEVLATIRTNGISSEDLTRARTAFESAFFGEMEGGVVPGFGKANLLGTFALFDNDPNRINTILQQLEKVTPSDVQGAAARWLVPTNRTSVDRRPVAGGVR